MTPRTTAPVRDDVLALLEELPGRDPNLPEDPGPIDAEHGWKVDDLCTPLPDERPGEPEDDGSFAAARDVLSCYGMAEPSIIRAAWDPEGPLQGRNMALEGRFAFLRFPMGVRVTHVLDDVIRVDGRQVHRWGWSYTTLEGHLEQGRMDWAVWKWLDDGRVDFRIHAFSRRGPIANPIIRLGFFLFGTWTQNRFYDAVTRRMQRLVAHRTQRGVTRSRCMARPGHGTAARPGHGAAA